jgi:hypothetical protein
MTTPAINRLKVIDTYMTSTRVNGRSSGGRKMYEISNSSSADAANKRSIEMTLPSIISIGEIDKRSWYG